MTTIAYRQVLERQRTDTLRREDGYPISTRQIDLMVERYAAKREQSFAKAGLADQRKLILGLGRLERKQVATFAEELAKHFNRLGRMVASAYLQVTELAVAKAEPPTPDDEEIWQAIQRIMSVRLWQMDTFVPSAESMVERIAFGTVEQINLRMSLGVQIPDWAMRQIVSDGGKRMGLIDFTSETRDSLFRSFREGRELGENSAAIARRIRGQVPAGRFRNAGAEYRARLIARTEVRYSQNRSSMSAYRASEAVVGCRAFDNQTGYDITSMTARCETSGSTPSTRRTRWWSPSIPTGL